MIDVYQIASDALEAARDAGYGTTWLPPITDRRAESWCVAWKDDELWFLERRTDGLVWTFVHRKVVETAR
jgi:hypothetical protein